MFGILKAFFFFLSLHVRQLLELFLCLNEICECVSFPFCWFMCVFVHPCIETSRCPRLSTVDYSSTVHNRWTNQPVFYLFYLLHYPFLIHSLLLFFSLSLPSKDLCGAHRQESLILRLGRPYTLLLHTVHAYIESVEAGGGEGVVVLTRTYRGLHPLKEGIALLHLKAP